MRYYGRMLLQYPVRFLPKSFSALIEKRVLGGLRHVATREAVAALTFDDGPHPQSTPALLDVLEQYQVHATFFMLGELAQQYPELVRKVAQAGHAIGNHSWDHPHFSVISSRDQRWQMRACERALAPYGQRLFRPPFGQHDAASRFNAWWLGYRVIMWDLDARDWIDDNAHSIAARLVHRMHSGSIQGDRIILTRLPFLSHSVCYTAITKALHERRRAQVRAPGTDLVYTPAWRGRL
jgi:peptidoglycan/xylan/chitin deacetylase (PgdA/CDA1 family)